MTRTLSFWLKAALALVAVVALAGCAVRFGFVVGDPDEDAVSGEGDQWAVVTFRDTGSGVNLMDALEDTELAADDALAAAGAGVLDGNEVSGDTYELYFVGEDRRAMWQVLEPVFADAPVHRSTVELRDGLDDPNPTVIKP